MWVVGLDGKVATNSNRFGPTFPVSYIEGTISITKGVKQTRHLRWGYWVVD